ncbi:DUF1294 domain-containing protein [Brevibacillus laterosporus]|uniref:DUF1294 domain-containing protein n=1 Tax=Brevibacillus laterosporus TaxID=1465 RepID=UPI0035A71F97
MIPRKLQAHKRQRNSIFLVTLVMLLIGVVLHQLLLISIAIGFINLYALCAMGWDKRLARKHNSWRIPEATFFLLAALGGAVGVGLGMLLWRHKTKHPSFCVLIPLCLLWNGGALYVMWYYVIPYFV